MLILGTLIYTFAVIIVGLLYIIIYPRKGKITKKVVESNKK